MNGGRRSSSSPTDLENLRAVILRTIDGLAELLGLTPAQVLAELDTEPAG